jgi:hypothetical protein
VLYESLDEDGNERPDRGRFELAVEASDPAVKLRWRDLIGCVSLLELAAAWGRAGYLGRDAWAKDEVVGAVTSASPRVSTNTRRTMGWG